MKKLLILLGCFIVFLAGCTSSKEKQLEGTWDNVSYGGEWAEFKNGKMIIQGEEMKMENIKSYTKAISFDINDNEHGVDGAFTVGFDEDDKDKAKVMAIGSDQSVNTFEIEKTSEGAGIIKRFFSFIFQAALLVIGGMAVMLLMDKIFKRK